MSGEYGETTKEKKPISLKDPIQFEMEVIKFFKTGYTPELIFKKLHNAHYKLPENFNIDMANDPEYQKMVIKYLREYIMQKCMPWPLICRIYSMPMLDAPEDATAPNIVMFRFAGDSKYVTFFDYTSQQVVGEPAFYEVIKAESVTKRFRNRFNYDYSAGYNPTINGRFYQISGTRYFNAYNPPDWKSDLFYGKQANVPKADIPEIYRELFGHFFMGFDTPSCQFFLDWLAISLQIRCRTFLLLVSSQGTGKGTLGKIAAALHGETNAEVVGAKSANDRFNSIIENKTLMFFNEIHAYDAAAVNDLKEFIDDRIKTERKGVDAVVKTNWMNCIFSTNNFGALKIEKNDRRWSILETVETSLNELWPQGSSKFEEVLEPKNIEALAQNLFNRAYDPVNVNKPFKSEKAAMINDFTLSDWQQYLENDFYVEHKGACIKVSDLLNYLKSKGFKLRTENLNDYVKSHAKNVYHKYIDPRTCVNLVLHEHTGRLEKPAPGYDFKIADRGNVIFVKGNV